MPSTSSKLRHLAPVALWISAILALDGCSEDPRDLVDSDQLADGGVDAGTDADADADADADVDADADADDDGDDDVTTCEPRCEGRQCGDDSCGGQCGSCPAGQLCDEPTSECGVVADVTVPMVDGTRLQTTVYLPEEAGAAPVPAMLLRTPYRLDPALGPEVYDTVGSYFQDKGYATVIQDCRSSVALSGDYYSFEAEVVDGQTAVEWIVDQPWSNRDVGTFGGSYEGYTALAAAVDNPHVKVVIASAPAAGIAVFNDNAISLDTILILDYWANSGVLRYLEDPELLSLATNTLDLGALDEVMLGHSAERWQQFLEHPQPSDSFWDEGHLRTVWDRICAPVLVTSCVPDFWFDPIEIIEGLWSSSCPERRADQRLLIGNWGHSEVLYNLFYDEVGPAEGLVMDYIESYLKGEGADLSHLPSVIYELQDGVELHEADAWPPSSEQATLYLHHQAAGGLEGLLLSAPPIEPQPSSDLVVDPEVIDPCDALDPGPWLSFSTEPLTEPIRVVGAPQIELEVQSTGRDADLFALLMAEYPDDPESAEALSYGFTRARYQGGDEVPIVPGETVSVTVDMPPVIHEIQPGQVLVLMIFASGCANMENPHTGEPITAQTRWNMATHQILHEPENASHLTLPFVATSDSPIPRMRSRPPSSFPRHPLGRMRSATTRARLQSIFQQARLGR